MPMPSGLPAATRARESAFNLAVPLGVALAIAIAATPARAGPATSGHEALRAFATDRELDAVIERWAEQARSLRQAPAGAGSSAIAISASPVIAPEPAAAAPPAVTNVQHAGVDEGGIVKTVGDHLVILRRGRLFTVRIAQGQLKPVASANAWGPGVGPSDGWYDEIVVSGNRVAVLGYSGARGGTEIGLFEVSPAGQLRHRGTFHLRSNDYYSTRNYASRLIGTQLVVYAPLDMDPWARGPVYVLPAVRRWHPAATPAEFRRTVLAPAVYRIDDALDPFTDFAIHSVTRCDLARPGLECKSTAVVAPRSRAFYVSPDAVYAWTKSWGPNGRDARPRTVAYRIPLDGSAPRALEVAGSPIDQFSFHEDRDRALNVLVQSEGRADGPWAPEVEAGDLALLRVPVASFSRERRSAPVTAYRPLPRLEGALRSRFVGPYLVYGARERRAGGPTGAQSALYVLRYAGAGDPVRVSLGHALDRIEAVGEGALAVGSNGEDLYLTSIRLGRGTVVDRYRRKAAAESDLRSHAFLYRPAGTEEGVLGLPIVGLAGGAAGHRAKDIPALLYLRSSDLRLTELGTLDARADARDDGCRLSCVDWYGNARPLFIGERVFALMGYEIVEGALNGTRVAEVRRTSFAPRAQEIWR